MVRRSLTLERDVDVAIQHYRADFLQKGINKPYTKAVNELLREALKITKAAQ